MTIALITPPAVEPLQLADAKAHLRIDGDEDDTLIGVAITAARVHVEAMTRRMLIAQQWRVYLDAWPRKRIVSLAPAPLISIDAVKGAFEAMIAGKLNVSVECSPLLGPQLMSAVKDIKAGKAVPKRIVTEEGIFPMEVAAQEFPKRKY